jgi:transposase
MRYIPPNPENGTQADLMVAMKASPKQQYYIRLEAIRFLMLGCSLQQTSFYVLRTERTVRTWVALWNRGGLDALLPKRQPGRPRLLEGPTKDHIIHLLHHPQEAGQAHWTARKLHGFLSRKEALELGYSTLTRNFRQWGFRLKVPRPWPLKQDEVAREVFRQELAVLLQDPAAEVWFSDETGILGDPRPRRRWVMKGERATVPFTGLHLRSNVVGAVNPKSGELEALIVPYMDSYVFQIFLDHLARETRGRRITLVLDNASWHKVKSLTWHHLIPKYLPPYSPDLNPIERLWQNLKGRYFADWIAQDADELENRVDEGLKSFLTHPEQIASICRT